MNFSQDFLKNELSKEAWNPEFFCSVCHQEPKMIVEDWDNLYFEQESRENGFICKYYLEPEEDEERYSVICENLIGVCSCGNFPLDCHYMIMDAFDITIETYTRLGMEIPWKHK